MDNGKALSIDDVLSCDDGVVQQIATPEWGGTVYLRSMSGYDRDRIIRDYIDEDGRALPNIRAAVVAACWCGADGSPAKITTGQVNALGQKNSAVLERLFSAAQRLSGFNEVGIEEQEKNSLEAQNGGSG